MKYFKGAALKTVSRIIEQDPLSIEGENRRRMIITVKFPSSDSDHGSFIIENVIIENVRSNT